MDTESDTVLHFAPAAEWNNMRMRKELSAEDKLRWSWLYRDEPCPYSPPMDVYEGPGEYHSSPKTVPGISFTRVAYGVYNNTFQQPELPDRWSSDDYWEEVCEGLRAVIRVTPDDVDRIAALPQRSFAWKQSRQFRITASRFAAFMGNSCNIEYGQRHRAFLSMLEVVQDDALFTANYAMTHGVKNETMCEKTCLSNYGHEVFHRALIQTVGREQALQLMSSPASSPSSSSSSSASLQERKVHTQEEWPRQLAAPTIETITVFHEGMAVWPDYPMIGASSDGIAWVQYSNNTWDCFNCEWKCPVKRGAYEGCVPSDYWFQMQQQLAVYWESGRIHKLAKARGISLEKDMVPGWTWRSMFGVYQHGRVTQCRFVPYHRSVYMRVLHNATLVYWTQFAPRWWLKKKGVIRSRMIDYAPTVFSSDKRTTIQHGHTQTGEHDDESKTTTTATTTTPLPSNTQSVEFNDNDLQAWLDSTETLAKETHNQQDEEDDMDMDDEDQLAELW